MNVFKRIWTARSQKSWDSFIRDWLSGNDDAATGDPISVCGTNALKLNVVFACLRVIGETFASVPIFEYKKIDDKTREKTDETGVYDVLHNAPNDEMSAFSFKEMAAYQINLGGNFVCERKNTRYGELLELYPYEYDNVEIDREKDGARRIFYNLLINHTEKKKVYRDKIFHVAGPSTNGIVGMSPIKYASNSIKLGLTWEQLGNSMFKNGTFPTGVFKHPGELKQEAYERLKEDIDNRWAGGKNLGKPILAEDGLDFTQLKISLEDMQIIDSKRFTTEDICRIFRVQPHLVQDLSRSTNNNIEHQSLEFVMYTMLPWFKRFEEAVNCQLLTRQQRGEGYYFEFNVSALLRGDQKSMSEAFAIGRQWGWLSVNDIRRLLNMNPVVGGDTYLQPMNMVPVGTKYDVNSENYKKILDDVQSLIEQRS